MINRVVGMLMYTYWRNLHNAIKELKSVSEKRFLTDTGSTRGNFSYLIHQMLPMLIRAVILQICSKVADLSQSTFYNFYRLLIPTIV